MEREEKVVVILLIMVFLSLSIAYVFFFSENVPDTAEFSSSSQIGDKVMLEGTVVSKRFTYTGDHLLLTVDSGSDIVSVFIPSDNGAMNAGSRINEDDTVSLSGVVDEYNGEIEIVIRDENDITVVSAAT
ncbi:nucleotide-binding protein [Methanolobus zinderi]|uniref:Nucleotide-binding protein n=1 Tax=Methanolobus zinderi TaxID=536044 RepID=A0A7D5E9A3_9EURY|nr:OB-fold nucleic acid binding domain-containing protein [Methanolobus zinderi]QLC50297.1 nucleotide-binding protein [Methanolobus zinderi]